MIKYIKILYIFLLYFQKKKKNNKSNVKIIINKKLRTEHLITEF